ncbi:hypothetical protein JOM56_003864 [Amanita muscaria]
MSNFPWIKFTGLTLGLMGFGYGLMKVTTPTEEQLYKEMAPDLKRKVDASKAARMARSAEIKGTVQPQVLNLSFSLYPVLTFYGHQATPHTFGSNPTGLG